MKRVFVLLLTSGLLAACQTSGGSRHPGVATELSAAQARSVEAGLRKTLRNPRSARFSGIRAAKSQSGVVTVCGYVSAVGRDGRRAGNKPFIGGFASNGTFVPLAIGGPPDQEAAIRRTCASRGAAV